MREACEQTSHWREAGLRLESIAVNVSALNFRRPDFVEGVQAILRETGLEPGRLQLEITESVLMHDALSAAQVLRQLKALGVELAIDDFGTGYSSLSYLTQFSRRYLEDRSIICPDHRRRRRQWNHRWRGHRHGGQSRTTGDRRRRRNSPPIGLFESASLRRGAGVFFQPAARVRALRGLAVGWARGKSASCLGAEVRQGSKIGFAALRDPSAAKLTPARGGPGCRR